MKQLTKAERRHQWGIDTKEFSKDELERQEFVDNEIYKLLDRLLPEINRPVMKGFKDNFSDFKWDAIRIKAVRILICKIYKWKFEMPAHLIYFYTERTPIYSMEQSYYPFIPEPTDRVYGFIEEDA